jgi:methionyl aminopeptidase
MEEVAGIVSQILTKLANEVKPGMTGLELDELAEALIASHGATSYNKGYKPDWAPAPFPAALCISPNGIVMHGAPSAYKFKEGDIITIDLGIKKNGLCGDAALTVPVGKVSNEDERLLYYSRQAIYEYIQQLREGVNTRELAGHIQQWALLRGFKVNRRAAGHTIGEEMHMKPTLYNTLEDDNHDYQDLQSGTVCVEVVLTKSRDNLGMYFDDGWGVATMDRKNCAMFEHMVRINKDNTIDVLTNHFNRDVNFKVLE